MDKLLVIIVLALCLLNEGVIAGNFQKSEKQKQGATNTTSHSHNSGGDNILGRLSSIENEMKSLREENTRLKEEINHLKNVESNAVQMDRQIHFLKSEASHLRTLFVKVMEQEIGEQLSEFKSDIQDLKAAQNYFVSFTAYATVDRNYDTDERIVFDGLVRNYGGHYDDFTSVFTCPTKGYYLFSLSVQTLTEQLYATIRLSEKNMVSVVAHAVYDDASNLVVTLCEEGQVVDVICTHDGNLMQGGRGSSFSGVLLQLIVE